MTDIDQIIEDWQTSPGNPPLAFADSEANSKDLSHRQVKKDEVNRLRNELFKTGSSFLPTARSEIIGIDNVLEEVDDAIHWLLNSKEYQKYGARLEPGIIFEGEPGVGKTLCSRYIATASGAQFINVREFPITGTYMKAADIADLFGRARVRYTKTQQPIILFWDEFESGAQERANCGPEQAAAVSQLTAELDGIHGKNEGVLLIGCTNYIYGIDAALQRSGRMGLQIEFSTPDREGKKLLLDYYLGKHTLEGAIDTDTLSYFFDSDANAADIEEACVEAWRNAVRRKILGQEGLPHISQQDLVRVFIKRLVGPPSTFVNLPLDDLMRIAIHEAGHAIMALIWGIPLRLITVQPGKKSLGRVITAEVREHIGTMDEWESLMRVSIGSIVAEEEAGVPALVGSTSDIASVNKIATRLVDTLYQGDYTGLLNPRAIASIRTGRTSSATPNVGQNMIEGADSDIGVLVQQTYAEARLAMQAVGPDVLNAIASELTQRVTLTGAEFREVFIRHAQKDPKEFLPHA